MPIDLTPTPSPTLSAYYGTFNRLVAEVGSDNVNTLADINDDADPVTIANSQQSAMTVADDMINSALNQCGIITPTLQNLTILATIWAKFAAYQLYQLKGIDETKSNYYTEKFNWATKALNDLTFGNRGGFATNSSNQPYVRYRGY